MKALCVYILKCADDTYYTGVTNNLERRVHEHKHGSKEFSYTYSRKPLVLVWQCVFQSKMEAIRWEKRIKGWSRKKKEALISGNYALLHELSVCRNESHSDNYKGHASTPLKSHASTPLSMTKPTPLRQAQGKPLSITNPDPLDKAKKVTLSGDEG